MTSPPRPVPLPLLHRFLGIGLVMTAAVLFFVRSVGAAPLVGTGAPLVAYAASGGALVQFAVAFLVFKPRVPQRPMGESVEQYWSTPQVVAKILPVWFLMEGAGIIAAVGYFLTGEPVSALVAGLAIVAFWLTGPNVFGSA